MDPEGNRESLAARVNIASVGISCASCFFWRGDLVDGTDAERGASWGDCRRFPPSFDPRHDASTFPRTRGDAVCGEWRQDDESTAAGYGLVEIT